MRVDLSTCVFGQRVITRKGEIYRYEGVRHYPEGDKYLVSYFPPYGSAGFVAYKRDGKIYLKKKLPLDIVEVVLFDQYDEKWALSTKIERLFLSPQGVV